MAKLSKCQANGLNQMVWPQLNWMRVCGKWTVNQLQYFHHFKWLPAPRIYINSDTRCLWWFFALEREANRGDALNRLLQHERMHERERGVSISLICTMCATSTVYAVLLTPWVHAQKRPRSGSNVNDGNQELKLRRYPQQTLQVNFCIKFPMHSYLAAFFASLFAFFFYIHDWNSINLECNRHVPRFGTV